MSGERRERASSEFPFLSLGTKNCLFFQRGTTYDYENALASPLTKAAFPCFKIPFSQRKSKSIFKNALASPLKKASFFSIRRPHFYNGKPRTIMKIHLLPRWKIIFGRNHNRQGRAHTSMNYRRHKVKMRSGDFRKEIRSR